VWCALRISFVTLIVDRCKNSRDSVPIDISFVAYCIISILPISIAVILLLDCILLHCTTRTRYVAVFLVDRDAGAIIW